MTREPPQNNSEDFELEDPGVGQTAVIGVHVDHAAPGQPICDEKGVIKSGRLKGLGMWAAIWVVSWPVLFESLLNATVGLVDTTLAASLSEAATDAIGVAAYFGWLLALVGMALGIGTGAMVSRSIGKGRVAVANATLGQTTILAGTLGVIVGFWIYWAAPGIASWMNLEDEAVAYAVNYLHVLAFSVPALTLLLSWIAACRGAGDSFTPLWVMAFVNVINIVVSVLLCGADLATTRMTDAGEIERHVFFVNPSPVDLGTTGIAIGTLCAYVVGALIMGVVLSRGVHGLRFKRRRLAPNWRTMKRLVRVAVPNAIETFGMWFGNFLTFSMIGWMATPGFIGAHVVAVRIEAFSFLPGFAMSTAAATLAGQYLGAKAPHLARLAIIRCTLISVLIMGLFGVLFTTAPEFVVGLLSQQPAHLELTPPLLVVCGVIQVFFATAITIRGALRGAGDTTVVMALTWISTYAIRLPLAWLFCGVDIPLPESLGGGHIINPDPLREWLGLDIHPLTGFWLGLCAELVLRALLFVGRFLGSGWTRVKV
ncbi:MAG: MATE family efflux transporter [Planctomycetota bacterium]